MVNLENFINNFNSKIIIIGSGISGLNMGMYLKMRYNFHNFVIFEGESDLGGTWLTNNYPGAGCDVNSHRYAFYDNFNPNWSSNYSGFAEIHAYLSNTAKKFNLLKHIKFNTWVTKGRFNIETNKWKLHYYDKLTMIKSEIECDYLIGAVGALRIPNVPIEFTNFEGPMMHSARWDHSVDLKDKVVGVVGSGASGVQIVPNIIDQVEELHIFQRSAPYVVPKGISDYSNFYKLLFKWLPFFHTLYYWYFFLKSEKGLKAFYTNSSDSKRVTNDIKEYINKSIKNPIKRELMTPKYHFGCKRITPADSYYKSIDQDKSFIHDGNIDKIEGHTLYMKDGTNQTVDVLILATGFKATSPYEEIDLLNLDGDHIDTNLDKIGCSPQLNYGITAAKMPNFFMMKGPTTGLGHNSSTFMIECQANYIAKALKHIINNKVIRFELKPEVGDAYWQWVQRRIKPMAWHGNCKSWYQNSNGKVITIWPGSCIEYWWKTYSPNFSEYNIIYKA